MRIEKAKSSDSAKLTELTFRSKAHWGYSKKQLEEWRDELTVTPTYIRHNQVFKLTGHQQVIGFYAFRPENKTDVKLDFLFMEPRFIGKGYGKHLMDDCTKRIRSLGYKTITLDADPNAATFYGKVGFRVIGQLQSSIKERFLPIMKMTF
ncbi:GNAT family N-acetyltransferase [Flavobacteriaceae bacterium TP-CH-4]|uniref:GNAT family N-acetyltransferase n=1 Tax=Pelagihabitans pacificus TaxID=2696054 RepID=A0A967AVK9_9FLAO|nr:GNAT family N-acetyltransferase [Pelagihabitans pacificus]NHF61206.1 GNAT family N-acetyltransferase [Pelagihabitans pacificus]